VPYGTAVTGLIANFTTTGASIKVNGVAQTSGTTSNSFTTPVTYTVVAADQSTQAYVVTVTIAAKPKYNLTISVGSGGGGTVSPSGQVQVNQGDQTPIIATHGSGYAFVNWTTTSGAVIANANSATTNVTLNSGNATVTANFIVVYSVTYKANGGSGNAPIDGNFYQQGESVTVKTNVGLSLSGYTFIGWNTKSDGSGITYQYKSSPTSFLMGTSNITLFANWDVLDTDGNRYDVVIIGTQTWMLQNLKTTHLNDGTPIYHSSGDYSSTPEYIFMDNAMTPYQNYGALYNFSAVTTGKLAPKGWHVPSSTEWQTLIDAVKGNGQLLNASSSFAALLGGMYDMSFDYFMSQGFYWSNTPLPPPNSFQQAYCFGIDNQNNVQSDASLLGADDCSIRCVLGNP
jgi:uncharacterized protein (TIGR02145 family)/uncharacterized repeat protein (TIGR02543 family)